jgi:hypothetical protein
VKHDGNPTGGVYVRYWNLFIRYIKLKKTF